MHLDRRKFLLNAVQLFDLGAIGVAVCLGALAYSQRISFEFNDMLALRVKVSNFVLLVVLVTLCHLILRFNGLYESRRFSTRKAEVADILKAVAICAFLFMAAAVSFRVELVTSRWFLGVFCFTASATIIASRMILRRVLAQLRRRGRNLRQVLIVGTNKRAASLAAGILGRPELGYSLLGFVDDPWPGLSTFHPAAYPVVCDLNHMAGFLRETVVDEVFICLPVKSYYERIGDIVERCEDAGIIVRLLGDFFDLRVARAKAETFDEGTMVTVYTGQIEGWPGVAKRMFDIAAATALLIVFAPVFAITALAIKLTSVGPVFFIQERVGISKRRFRLCKFRTMVVDAEARQQSLEALNEAGGPVFKMTTDPRITGLGRFLRKTSIDELPQLFNVLRGDMSLVGPRPLPIRDFNGFDQDWHRRRFSVRPGITCLWQVNGRSNISFDRWMELDMEYIDRWSLWLDMKILMKTVPAVLKGSGAV
jgi:exopolysaccharide biosynthesis polyprenyl glycosylphosphotransferase